ncbi:MAG: hypothetical protein QM778_08325 [Myxococcales bacterium]
MSTLRIAVSALCLAGLSACSGQESQPPAAAAPEVSPPAAAAPAEKKAEPPKPSIDDTSFHLALESQPTYTAGQAGSVQLVLEARGGYHVNEDYPLRVDLKAPSAVKLTKGSLGKADAAQIGQERARFDLGFSAEPGTHELLATVDFAVCTKETCVPDQRTVAVALKVQ